MYSSKNSLFNFKSQKEKKVMADWNYNLKSAIWRLQCAPMSFFSHSILCKTAALLSDSTLSVPEWTVIDVCLLEMEMSLRGLFEGFAFIMWTYMHHFLITLPSCRFCFSPWLIVIMISTHPRRYKKDWERARRGQRVRHMRMETFVWLLMFLYWAYDIFDLPHLNLFLI